MIANSQQALAKANEMVQFYSSFLPDDYFKQQNLSKQSISNFSSFLSKFKASFDDTKHDSKRQEQLQSSPESTNSHENISFKSADKVYEFILDVI